MDADRRAALERIKAAYPAGTLLDEAAVPDYTLPELLVCADGTPVVSAADWFARRRPELPEEVVQRAGLGQLENSLNLAGLRSAPDQVPVGPFPERQAQGADEDRLARPRLARDHVQARIKFDKGALDQRDIAYV